MLEASKLKRYMVICNIDAKHASNQGKPYNYRVGLYATLEDCNNAIATENNMAGNTFGGLVDKTNKGRTYQIFKATWQEEIS